MKTVWKVFNLLLLAIVLLLIVACTSRVSQPEATAEKTVQRPAIESITKGSRIVIDSQIRHLGDNRMPESKSPEWAPVREPEATFFETDFKAPDGIKKAELQINTFGSESELNPVYLNGKQVGGLCEAFDKDGWKICKIELFLEDIKETNTIKIDTHGADRDDLMIEGIFFVYEK